MINIESRMRAVRPTAPGSWTGSEEPAGLLREIPEQIEYQEGGPRKIGVDPAVGRWHQRHVARDRTVVGVQIRRQWHCQPLLPHRQIPLRQRLRYHRRIERSEERR